MEKATNTSVKLNLAERIYLLGLLPKTGKFETLIVSKELSQKLDVTVDEIAEFEMKTVDKGMWWNEKGRNASFEFDFKELERVCIKGLLMSLNDKEELPIELMNIYSMFCL